MNKTKSQANEILKSVSRSFFLSLKILPSKIRPGIGLGYLLCRAADSITDVGDQTAEDRLQLLADFKHIFTTFPISKKELRQHICDLDEKGMLPRTKEGDLLRQLEICVSQLEEVSRTEQTVIQDVLSAVVYGMEIDLSIFGNGNDFIAALKSEEELERYIHWIGGEPGRFWTKMCLIHFPGLSKKNREAWMANGILFGTGLQMVNILRDLPQDLKRGRCYIPTDLLANYGLTPEDILNPKRNDDFFTLYNSLLDKALLRLEHGLAYIKHLPLYSIRLRAAVWWPLILGVQTLGTLRQSPSYIHPDKVIKIGRPDVYKTIVKSIFLLANNGWLKKEFIEKARGFN